MATLLEAGTHEQKLRHVPAILRGEELWVQFLSEPSGGSDLAGCLTRAERDGDLFMLNGSKIWSSGAASADYALCLARTNWDVPKHRGLTMFIVKIHQPGVTVEQIRQTDGSTEFCQEFFDDVPLPVADVVGDVDDGWSVANRLLVHERMAVGGGSPYTAGRSSKHEVTDDEAELVELIRSRGLEDDQHARLLLADAAVRTMVRGALVDRVTTGMTTGAMPGSAGSLIKLFGADAVILRAEIGLRLAGADAVAWPADAAADTAGARVGEYSLGRQGAALGGGSNEIQRNIISERLLGMPARRRPTATSRTATSAAPAAADRPPDRSDRPAPRTTHPRGDHTMTTFDAFVLTKDDDGTQHLDWTEVDETDLMDGDVTVDVSHSTLNYKDGLALTGSSPVVRRWPMIPGIDFVGTVRESGHDGIAAGDAVVLNGWGVGETHLGGYAQRARVPGEWLVPLPDGVHPGPVDGHRHRGLHRGAVRARPRAPRRHARRRADPGHRRHRRRGQRGRRPAGRGRVRGAGLDRARPTRPAT